MSSSLPIGLCYGSASNSTEFCSSFMSNASNLMRSTNGCDMFVHCVGGG
jgi:hypothetical protein